MLTQYNYDNYMQGGNEVTMHQVHNGFHLAQAT